MAPDLGYQMVTFLMTSRDHKRPRSCPRYSWMQMSRKPLEIEADVLFDDHLQVRWQIAKLACEQKKRKYTLMTSQYQQWQKSVHRVERRLADVEKRMKQTYDPATAAVRAYFSRCMIYLLIIFHNSVYVNLRKYC